MPLHRRNTSFATSSVQASSASDVLIPHEQRVTISTKAVTKRYFSTHDSAENQFGYHRAVRKGPFIFVSGTTAETLVSDVAAPGGRPVATIIPRGSGFVVAPGPTQMIPVGSGFLVGAASTVRSNDMQKGKGLKTSFSQEDIVENYDDGFDETTTTTDLPDQETVEAAAPMKTRFTDQTPPNELPPPYELPSRGNYDVREKSPREEDMFEPFPARRVHIPDSAKEQALLAMSRSLHAVQNLGGHLEDVVRVRMYLTHNADIDAVGEAFRECFSVEAMTYGRVKDGDGRIKRGAAGIRVGEVGCAASTIVIGEGGLGNTQVKVMVEVEALCGCGF